MSLNIRTLSKEGFSISYRRFRDSYSTSRNLVFPVIAIVIPHCILQVGPYSIVDGYLCIFPRHLALYNRLIA